MKHNTRPGKVERMVYLTILVSVIPFFKKTGCGNARHSLFVYRKGRNPLWIPSKSLSFLLVKGRFFNDTASS